MAPGELGGHTAGARRGLRSDDRHRGALLRERGRDRGAEPAGPASQQRVATVE